jgi:hypothetical protein
MVQKNMHEETLNSSQAACSGPAHRCRGIEVGLDDPEQPHPRRVDLMIPAILGREQRNDL